MYYKFPHAQVLPFKEDATGVIASCVGVSIVLGGGGGLRGSRWL